MVAVKKKIKFSISIKSDLILIKYSAWDAFEKEHKQRAQNIRAISNIYNPKLLIQM